MYQRSESDIGCRTVHWPAVHQWVLDRIKAESWPMIGTLAWQELPDGHPAKTAAVLDAAQHWALYLEGRQAAMAEASQAISGAVDWVALANELSTIRAYRSANPWSAREAS